MAVPIVLGDCMPDPDSVIDPAAEAPAGYDEDQRDQPGGFHGDPDVMDTWATSSLTPYIAGGWQTDPELFAAIFPMDQRPQGHDIIRTWLFSTVVRAHYEFGSLPWRHATLNGWILDPDRKKMSKSKGNATTPLDMLQEHGSDGVRYWAASARLGIDAALDTAQMKVGRRLAIKVLNASRFALSFGDVGEALDTKSLSALVTEPLDRAMLASLGEVVDVATAANEALDYTRALEVTESFFWAFCDDYLELVKDRAYGSASADDGDGGRPWRGVRASGAAPRPRHPAAPAGTGSRVRDRGGVVVVPRHVGGFDPPGRVADDGRARRRPRGRPGGPRGRRGGAHRHPQGQVRRQGRYARRDHRDDPRRSVGPARPGPHRGG